MKYIKKITEKLIINADKNAVKADEICQTKKW